MGSGRYTDRGSWRAADGVLVLCCLPRGSRWVDPCSGWLGRAYQTVGLDYAEPVIYGQAMRIVSGKPMKPMDALRLHAAYTAGRWLRVATPGSEYIY